MCLMPRSIETTYMTNVTRMLSCQDQSLKVMLGFLRNIHRELSHFAEVVVARITIRGRVVK